MMLRKLERLKAMDAAEIAWRARASLRIAGDRVRMRIKPARWVRADLRSALSDSEELAAVRAAVAAGSWAEAHRALARHFAAAPQRFVIAHVSKKAVVRRITSGFPGAAGSAGARADRILGGDYDLLGYRGLRFDGAESAERSSRDLPTITTIDWHLDPVSGRRAPRIFWADVPYLDPSCGDHKVVWEFNRHQHWIALGRAYWLTGDAKYRRRALAELACWLDANPPLAGVNWASMLELALRSISWMWTINFFADDAAADERPWLVDLLVALDRQLAHIERNLSYYFSPNTHLLGEALALYVCGRALPQLAASERREALGRAILTDEIERQIAGDGGHAERSTHYQRYTLDFYCLALAVARLTGDAAGCDRFDDAVARLALAARLLADDQGLLPHLGDDDGGALLPLSGRPTDDVRDSLCVAAALTGRTDLWHGPALEEVVWIANGLEDVNRKSRPANAGALRSSALSETGYYVSRSAGGSHLVIDGGPHGYRNGGHAHADALAMTCAVRGLPLLIDPGTACYTIDPALRDRMRSTALHNTITVDGRSQSLPCGPFQWTHVAHTRVRAWRANDGFDFFDGSHDGYAPLEHRRRVFALHGDLIVVADLVSGPGTHQAAAHWHLDPRWTVDVHGSHAILRHGEDRVGLTVAGHEIEALRGDAASGLGWYSPAYGSLLPTTALRIRHENALPFWLISVFDLNPENRVLDIETIPVWAEAGTLAHGAAVRIARAASTDFMLFAERDSSTASPADSDAPPPSARPTWRVSEIETDAAMLFCRAGCDRPIARLAIVDSSMVRVPDRRSFLLALPRIASDLHLDFTSDARVAGAAFGARLVVGGEERPIELDRRAAPRTTD